MTHYVETETGSIYELDVEYRRIRRLHGNSNSTPRVGKDGVWKKIKNATLPNVGSPMIFIWGIDCDPINDIEPGLPDGFRVRTTMTSRVISVKEAEFEV